MTLVNVDLRVPGAAGNRPAAGRLGWQPTQRRVDGTVVILPVRTSVDLPAGVASAEIDPGVYWFVEDVNGGESAYRIVPDVGPVEYATLAAVDPATLDPESVPPAAWYSYTDTLSALAGTSATAAQEARDAAVLSQDSAQASASAAALSETNAGTSALAAAGSATNANLDATAAGLSADSAAQSELAASGHATNAGNSASAAAGSAAGAESARGSMVIGGAVDGAGHLILTRHAANPTDAGYVVGPPITLSITETTTGPDTPGTPGPTGLTGPKGDPGGIVLGTVIDTVDLDTLKTAGVYRRTSTGTGLLALHYPADVDSGVLIVHVRLPDQTIFQEFHTFNRLSSGSRGYYLRTFSGSVWTAWAFIPSQRVDQTAGRAIYTWDHLNDREQLVYGDTGSRDIVASNGGNGTFAALKVRRVMNMVEVVCVAWVPNASGNIAPFAVNLGVGFRSTHTTPITAIHNNAPASGVMSNVGAITVYSVTSGASVSFVTQYFTPDPWPATLPGVASGAIQNL